MPKCIFKPAYLILLFFTIPLFAGENRPALIKIKDIAPDILVDMRYATPDNFTGQTLYPAAECLLCEPAAYRLVRVQARLKKQGLGLKVWDCYRPVSVQKKLWDRVPDDRYVANPVKGSRHNRGASVDLTLVDKNGYELPMPTKFDEFSDHAHRDFMDLPTEIIHNRKILEEAMEAEGFVGLPTEWWHFDDPEWAGYALRDEPLDSSSLLTDRHAEKTPPAIPTETRQLIVIQAKDWNSTSGLLRLYERKDGWVKIDEWDVSLGAKGLAWGRGLNSLDWKGPLKKEGDHRTPAGVFKIGTAYGPSATAPTGSKWPYQSIDEKWFCVDDSTSALYNRIIEVTDTSKKDWRTAETMKRSDKIYDWVINIEQNYPDVKAGCGSCIFFHVWRRPGAVTEGCTAMPEEKIRAVLSWLKPEDKPLAVFLTDGGVKILKELWGLP